MSRELNSTTGLGSYKELSGVNGDGLGQGEVDFASEGCWWEEGWRGGGIGVRFCADFSGVDGDGLGEGETAFEGEELLWEGTPAERTFRDC